jgi:transposase InsO family protein
LSYGPKTRVSAAFLTRDFRCRRGVPYDNAKAESFMKTIKTEEV